MRKLILGMSFLAAFLVPMHSLMAQATATPEQLLAAAILNGDDDPTNDVADPTTITDATSIISAAPAAAVQAAVAAVATADPSVAAKVAAAAAGNNSGVSVSQAAAAAGVSTAAVFTEITSIVGQAVVSSDTSGTGTGVNASGGTPSVADIEQAILENPGLISDILPGLSPEDIALVIEVIQRGGTLEDAISGTGLI